MSLISIIENVNLTSDKIYEHLFKDSSFESVLRNIIDLSFDPKRLKTPTSQYFYFFSNHSSISPFAYALMLDNFNFIQAFINFLEKKGKKFNLSNCRTSTYYSNYNYSLSRVLMEALNTNLVSNRHKIVLSEIFKYSNTTFDNVIHHHTALNWAIKNKNDTVLTYFAPRITQNFQELFPYIIQKNHHSVIYNYLLNTVMKKQVNITHFKEQFEENGLSKHILKPEFFYNFCKGISKKDYDIQKENLEYFFSLCDKELLFNTIYNSRKRTKGKTDPFIDLDRSRDNPVLILIKKDFISLVNLFLDKGYIPDEEDIKYILNSKNVGDISDKNKHFLENSEVDKLETLVKGFEIHLIKRQKTSNKNLRQFLSSLPEDDKNYLYDYYEQFKETNLSSYSFLHITGINNDKISVIDHIVKEGLYEQVNLLLENNFRFTNDQTRNFLDILSYNNVNDDYTKYDSCFSLEKFLTNIRTYLPESQIKNMFIYQVTYGHKMAFRHMDMVYNILLKDISFTETEVNLIISGRNQCQALLYKLSEDNAQHFFNHNSMFNYIKDFYLNMIFYNGTKKYHAYRLHEDFTDSPLCLKLLAKVAKIQPEFLRQLKNNLTNSALNISEVNEIMSDIEKSIITLDINITENSGNDKVKIRRRI